MSHEDVESSRVNESGVGKNDDVARRPGGDDFGRAVSKVAVAQICDGVGFGGFKDSALDSLSDIAIRYLIDIGKMANHYTNLAGRTESNVFDVVKALEDLDPAGGFTGVVEYVGTAEEIPFAQSLPGFPIVKEGRKMFPSFEQIGEAPPGKHLPNWLPAFPDPHTYVHTAMWNERKTDPREDQIEQARQRRKAERSLLSLQQRLLCNGSAPVLASTSAPVSLRGNNSKGVQLSVGESNPFLEPPLQPGEKDVSTFVLPSKFSEELLKGNDTSSVLEAFTPGIQAMQNRVWMEGEVEEERNLLPISRPPVHLKFRPVKKFLCESSDLSLLKKGSGRLKSAWSLRDEARDDKKRRAEFILRQSMENPQELNLA